MTNKTRERMAIIASYVEGETYGLLGPQMAATVIRENTAYDCIVIVMGREDDKGLLKKALADYFGTKKPVIGFSTLSGREDLFTLAGELKDEGALTIIAGPQADVDYSGETGWQDHSHRFPGLSKNFTFSLHGPAEQAIPLLQNHYGDEWRDNPGVLSLREDGTVVQNPKKAWDERFLKKVEWDNIYRLDESGLIRHMIRTGQVLQHIGCPHAARAKWVEIDDPASLSGKGGHKGSKLLLKGCSFCDVAVDKGFYGALSMDTVLDQISCLPEGLDGRKVPFELINENPLPGLPGLMNEIRARGIGLSQINLILRADWFLKGEKPLREALRLAKAMGVRILLSSVGFEAFDDSILRNLNKGLTVKTNLEAIHLMRRLKAEFPEKWAYSRSDGAFHGFIHPTPWDTEESWTNTQKIIDQYDLATDILPDHSVPLIIHHASGLGDWIREVEKKEKIRFRRYVSIIGWWKEDSYG